MNSDLGTQCYTYHITATASQTYTDVHLVFPFGYWIDKLPSEGTTAAA